MNFRQLVQKICFRARFQPGIGSLVRKLRLRAEGAQIGSGTDIPRLRVTWPHQISLGRECVLEEGIFFKFDGMWKPGPRIVLQDRVFVGRGCEFNIRSGVSIGDNCLIASGCKFIDHNHGMDVDLPMNAQQCPEAPITLESDVWLGVNVVVLKGVRIGRGAVVGAGAVVTKSISDYEIWAGIPARRIGCRAADRGEETPLLSEGGVPLQVAHRQEQSAGNDEAGLFPPHLPGRGRNSPVRLSGYRRF